MANLTEVRRRAWKTRRAKYGHKGHDSAYRRPRGRCADCERMQVMFARLLRNGLISEGTASRVTGLHRIELRKLVDRIAI